MARGVCVAQDGAFVSWDTALDAALATRDGPALRMLLQSNYINHLLKKQETVDRVGGVRSSCVSSG